MHAYVNVRYPNVLIYIWLAIEFQSGDEVVRLLGEIVMELWGGRVGWLTGLAGTAAERLAGQAVAAWPAARAG